MTAVVVLDNTTGAPIELKGCGSTPDFVLALGNDSIAPEIAFPAVACARRITVPTGRSRYRVVLEATYTSCNAPNELPRCPAGGGVPSLPPGDYRTVFFQAESAFPAPPPVVVHVRSAA